MLSDHERKTLLDIEHQLLAEDPNWALTFLVAGERMPRPSNLKWVAHIVAIVLAVGLFVLLVASNAPGPALFFAAVAGVLIWLMRRLHRSGAAPESGPADTGRSPA